MSGARRRTVAVTRHTDYNVKEVCSYSVGPGMVAPIVVIAVSDDGRSASARIEIQAARGRMQ